ncbi:hypothetical protein TIFTF001_024646 [Ficus carica]|uniref:Acid phosphatase/vanadium-dependent haloperoxidase-related protein n=1 Tax=Ficus carica TaxID=3494 RepID=A0AA88DKE7_FICCA|nr:hypothetical protein TIFTF001_024646 [Ficus carica]
MMSTISRASSLSSQSCCCCYWGFANPRKHPQNLVLRRRRSRRRQINAQLSDEILVQLLHNKALIAAGVSGAIGQLTKPLSGVILYGKEFDIKAAFQAGGFPSTHSSAVVAAATCLGLERGFSDSIFGITVVYAGLIMYDAQGVRREVGIHARTLNKVLKEKSRANSIPSKNIDGFDSQLGTSSSTLNYLSDESGSFSSKTRNSLLVPKSEKKTSSQIPSGIKAAEADEGSERSKYSPLKESIGHTEVEVIAGALLGLLVSLVVNTLL